MIGVWAVYQRGLYIISKRWIKLILSLVVSPLLYAIAFGWGIGNDLTVEGVSYLTFMLPGLIALSGMTQSFGIGTELNIARFFNRVFEEFLLAPVSAATVVLGNVFYGMTRGLLSFIILIGIGYLTGTPMHLRPTLILPVLLNCFLFASLGVFIALTVTTHRDMGAFTSFVIVPMSFLSNTFFSLGKLPELLQVLTKIIPLTHASIAIRGVFLGRSVPVLHYVAMVGYAAVFFAAAVHRVHRAVD